MNRGILLFGAMLAWTVTACHEDAVPDTTNRTAAEGDPEAYVDVGGLDRVRERGRIRFANVARSHLEELPRLRWGMPHERQLAQEFADRIGVEVHFEDYPGVDAATAALREGRVDVVIGHAGADGQPPMSGVAHSAAFYSAPGVLVGRTGEAPDSLNLLTGRRVAVAARSPLLHALGGLVSAVPSVRVDTLDVSTVEDVLDRLLDGSLDVVLAERWVAEAVAAVHPEIALGAPLGEVRYATAVRSSNPDLLRAINDFAFTTPTAGEGAFFGDLDEIAGRRILRVLTVNGPSTYYVYRGDLVGFDYELVSMFADEQDLLVQMVVAPSVDVLETWLARGLGDMIGAGFIPTAVRDTSAVRVTRPYHNVHPVLVARADLGVTSRPDLAGRTVVVGRNNPYLPLVEAVADTASFELRLSTDAESTHQLFSRLEQGEADATIVESHLAEAELADHPALVAVERFEDVPGRAWAARADQPRLLEALDAFFRREVGGTTHAVLIRKHFTRETRRVEQPDVRDDGSLSPWDDLVRTHAEAHEMDWRLVTAQMFQESRFDPRARSHTGAYGLMQMMPGTARQVGVRNLEDPGEQIRGGVAYLRWLYDRFETNLPLADRIAFTLAAYNAGYGHVSDARRVAELTGRDPDRWFEHVELAMLSLSDPDVYRQTRHGYVRGKEPVNYVRRISELGQMYYRLAPER